MGINISPEIKMDDSGKLKSRYLHWAILIVVFTATYQIASSGASHFNKPSISTNFSEAAGIKNADTLKTNVSDRAKRAEKVVVGVITSIQPFVGINDLGDKIIITRATVHIEDNLKANRTNTLTVDVDGGQIGNQFQAVSDMPAVNVGDRVVLFLKHGKAGTLIPDNRGEGILKLNSQNVNIPETKTKPGFENLAGLEHSDTGLSLDQIKAQIQSGK